MQRINWIDWAKALAVITVVFCHLPQSQEWFYYRYLQACIIVIFFWISGYLCKERESNNERWVKYWNSLILPYLLWNIIVYPFWLTKYCFQHRGIPDIYIAIKPLLGALLLESENNFCEPLNGPLWYLPAILILHIIAYLCHKSKYEHIIWAILCIMSVILYTTNKLWYFAPSLTSMGLMRNLPYYYIGYVMGKRRLFLNINPRRDFVTCISFLTVSIILFSWHLKAFFSGEHLLHIILFYPLYTCFLFGVLYGCKILDNIHSEIVLNLSIGTLLIIGLHMPLISVINAILSHTTILSPYHWYEALPIAVLITFLLYPLIICSKRFAPVLLGKKQI